MNQRAQVARRIREVGRGERGRAPELLFLPDDGLYQVYLQLRAGPLKNQFTLNTIRTDGFS